VRPADVRGHVFEVTGTWVDISGFTVDGATRGVAWIYFGTDHCNISDNIVSNNHCGICLLDSSSNTFVNNRMSENGYNFGVDGYSLSHYVQNIDTSNTVDGKPIYYWVNQTDRQIPSDAGFVGVVNGTNITVIDLTMTNNGEGVLFVYTENSRIENVTVSDNKLGIYLRSSSNNTLTDNTASNNHYGIYLMDSSNNTLTDNTASDDELNICLWSSSGNTIYHNNLAGNAYDTGTNQWDSGSEGNYYSDYNGADNNTDGIGDTHHPIPGGGGSIDRFPLMHPWAGGTSRKGDLNHDNQITPADAAIALQLAAIGAHDDAADVSGDNRVTSLDALMILQAAADRIKL
jgi:parallel beta-helix repeat protein